MKKKLLLSVLISVIFIPVFAQAPQGINYQAIARNSSGNALVNLTSLKVQFTILNASNTAIYTEYHSPVTTNQFGLFNLVIGKGTLVSGSFPDFSVNAPHSLKVEIDTNGISGYIAMPVMPFQAVPYALYAPSSAGPAGLNCWDLNGDGVKDANEDINHDGVWNTLDCKGDSGVQGPQGPAGSGIATLKGTSPIVISGISTLTVSIAGSAAAGSYAANSVPYLTVDAYGRVISASDITIASGIGGPATAVYGNSPIVISGTPITPTVTIATSGVFATAYGSATTIPTFTVDSYGRITNASNVNITVASGTATNVYANSPVVILGTPFTPTVSIANSNVIAGPYGSSGSIPTFTVDVFGRIISANNVTIASGANTSASNGVTLASANNIQLGGSLTSNVSIVLGSNNFSLVGPGNVGIGNLIPSSKLDVFGISTAAVIFSTQNGTGKAGAFSINNAASASEAVFASTNGSGTSVLATNTGSGSSGIFQINNPANGNSSLFATTNGTGNAGNFQITSGLANSSHSLYAITNGSGSGLFAENTFIGANDYRGIYGRSVNSPGFGYGGYFEGGYMGIYSLSNATSYAGAGYGIYSEAQGTGVAASIRKGVYGTASGGGLENYGVHGNASGAGLSKNYGVYGNSSGGTTNYGIYGYSSGGTTNYGIYGDSPGGISDYAGFFNGDLSIMNGNASIGNTPITNDNLYVFRPIEDFGADKAGIYSYRYGSGALAANGGTSWSETGVDAAIKGYSYWGNNYSAGLAGYNYNDYPLSTGVIGYDVGSNIFGALAYNDGATHWGIYTPNDIYVGSNAYKPGGGMWIAPSDRRIKKDISNFSDGLSYLMKINPVTFRYNGKTGIADTSAKYVGVIAQEMQKILPYTVTTKKKRLNPTDTTDTDILVYDGNAVPYVIINAIKEQQSMISNQQKEIDLMKQKLENQQNSINLLKAQNDYIKTMNLKIEAENTQLKTDIDDIKRILGVGLKVEK